MKKVRPFYANGQTFLLISSDLFVQKVRPFHIKGLTINTSPPQPTDADPAVIQRLHPGAMVETPGKVWAKSGQDLGKAWARLRQSVGRTGGASPTGKILLRVDLPNYQHKAMLIA